ncbi:MAG: phage baseplate assembly protein V, partial [Schlesneria sp.]
MIAANLAQSLGQLDETGVRRYLGLFKATVVDNVDPMNQGRVKLIVPEVISTRLETWANVLVPIGGMQHGLYAPIPINTKVYVAFEAGNLDYPVVAGCYRSTPAEVPSKAPPHNPLLHSITIQTRDQNAIVISDIPGPTGGIQITTSNQQKITMTTVGIEINNGMGASIKMIGPTIQIDATQVSINHG